MTRTAYWILGIGVVVFAAVVGGTILLNKKTTPSPSTSTEPSQTGYTGGLYPVTVTVAPVNSSTQEATTTTLGVREFLKDPETKSDPNNPGHYFLGNYIDPTIDQPPGVPYVIEYIEKTKYFSIALLQEPIGSARQAAEQYLMQHLGISEAQMCSLRYMVSTPISVNSTYAGTSLGFSFCPGATELPL